MSHIFDALQQSEAERSGVALDAHDLPTEVLQMAESALVTLFPTGDRIEPTPQTKEASLESMAGADELRQPTSPEQFECLPVSLLSHSKLVTLTEKEGLAAEKFRFLAVRLRNLQQQRPMRRLLITSTMPEEGKSTVAGNLACALAGRRRQKILLLEGDLRRPTLARQFGLHGVRGLTEFLQGASDTSVPVYRLEATGIWILPAGNSPHDSLELMQSPKLGRLMERLNSWFDWIVIDSPPVLPLADTSVWTRLADSVLLVTRRGVTDREQLKRGLEAIEPSKLLGALLNSSNAATHNDYYQRYRHSTTVANRNNPQQGSQNTPSESQ